MEGEGEGMGGVKGTAFHHFILSSPWDWLRLAFSALCFRGLWLSSFCIHTVYEALLARQGGLVTSFGLLGGRPFFYLVSCFLRHYHSCL